MFHCTSEAFETLSMNLFGRPFHDMFSFLQKGLDGMMFSEVPCWYNHTLNFEAGY